MGHLHNYQFVRVTRWTRLKAKIAQAEFMCPCGKVRVVNAKLYTRTPTN